MTGPLRALGALTLLVVAGAAATPAAAFVRSTTSPGRPDRGDCLWWGGRGLGYRVNAAAAGDTGCQTALAAEAAVKTGFDAWSAATRPGGASACTDFGFVKGAATSATAVGNDGTSLVVLRRRLCSELVAAGDACLSGGTGACAAKYNCWDDAYGQFTLGLTTTTFDAVTGQLLDADLELFAGDAGTHEGAYFTCAAPSDPACTGAPWGQTGCNWVDLAAVVAHEAGHMLGLAHPCGEAAPVPPGFGADPCPVGTTPVMAPQVNVATPWKPLQPDDVAAVCAIYPKGGETPTCAPPTPDQKGGGGCSSGGGAGLLALLGTALALRGRRR